MLCGVAYLMCVLCWCLLYGVVLDVLCVLLCLFRLVLLLFMMLLSGVICID